MLLFLLLISLLLTAKEISHPYKIEKFYSRSYTNDVTLCAEFNRYFMDYDINKMRQFIKVTPSSDFKLSVSYERVYIGNLKPRAVYTVSFAKEFPLGKQHLDKDYIFTKQTGDYEPNFRFKESGYIIPAKGEISTPLESVNIKRVAVALYRINRNNLMSTLNRYDFRQALEMYDLKDIQNESGYFFMGRE